MTTKLTKEELPPSIYVQYKHLVVQAVYATDTSFTVHTTVDGNATVRKDRWVRKDRKWVKCAKRAG